MNYTYQFKKLKEAPIIDRAPHHLRMATAFRDNAGGYHLFTDFIEAEQGTSGSWAARLAYYSSPDLENWTDHGIVVDKGKQGATREEDDFDVYGVASPHVLSTGGKVYLVYSGRGTLRPGEESDGRAAPGEPGFLNARIGLCVADADANGAPIMPFKKLGPVTELGETTGWIRHDDPCLALEEGRLLLYYKIITDQTWDGRKMARSCADLKTLKFSVPKGPILEIPGGFEMPRVFLDNSDWNMFVRPFDTGEDAIWQHYQSPDGENWHRINAHLLEKDPLIPVFGGASDMMLIHGMDGSILEPGLALCSGVGEQKNLNLWLYEFRQRRKK